MIYRRGQKVLVQGITGKQGTFWAARMMERGTEIVAGVNPKRAGDNHNGVPIFSSAVEAAKQTPCDVSVIFIPPTMAKDAIIDAINAGIPTIVVLTEHIPGHDVLDVDGEGRAAGLTRRAGDLLAVVAVGLAHDGDRALVGAAPGDCGVGRRTKGIATLWRTGSRAGVCGDCVAGVATTGDSAGPSGATRRDPGGADIRLAAGRQRRARLSDRPGGALRAFRRRSRWSMGIES